MHRAINTAIDEIDKDIFDTDGRNNMKWGPYNVKFSKDHMIAFRKLKKLCMNVANQNDVERKEAFDFIKLFKDKINTKEMKTGLEKLATFSAYLANFQGNKCQPITCLLSPSVKLMWGLRSLDSTYTHISWTNQTNKRT